MANDSAIVAQEQAHHNSLFLFPPSFVGVT
jgi:hypothetical protein